MKLIEISSEDMEHDIIVLRDRRRKLTEKQKEEIKTLYAEGNHSFRTLAADYGVSRKTIQYIINPITLMKHKESCRKYWKSRGKLKN